VETHDTGSVKRLFGRLNLHFHEPERSGVAMMSQTSVGEVIGSNLGLHTE
jgi:hypothetical protein